MEERLRCHTSSLIPSVHLKSTSVPALFLMDMFVFILEMEVPLSCPGWPQTLRLTLFSRKSFLMEEQTDLF
jgi:hypothetical protein